MPSTADRTVPSTPAWMLWTGRIVSALPIVGLAMSTAMKLSHRPDFVAQWTGHLGFREATLSSVGLLELLCVALYAIPQTSLIGALLLTAYLGGATASHVRIGDPFVAPVVLGVLAWAGLFLRDGRLRALLPFGQSARALAPAPSAA